MLAISMLALFALCVIGAITGVNGLMRNKAKDMNGLPSRRASQGAQLRKYVAERKWGIGLVLMFGISTAVVGIASNLQPPGGTVIPPGDDDDNNTDVPNFPTSGTNPNLTREDYTVMLSRYGAPTMFDPAGRGTTSLWGLCVNQMRIAYYGTDNYWHEASFQINEIGYRWAV